MKETEEMVVALLKLGKLVAGRLKDGAQLDDAVAIGTALVTDGALKAAVDAAVKDMDKIDEELKAAGVAEYLTLAAKILPEISVILKKA